VSACPEYDRLEADVSAILEWLREIAERQLDAFRRRDHDAFRQYDIMLESAVGEKERAVGALRQHCRDHKCQPMDAVG